MPADSVIPRRVRNSILLAFTLLFLGVGWSTVYRAGLGQRERTDFTVYHAAGRAVIEATPLYEAQNVRGWLYMYLPIFAVLMVPLAVLPKTLAAGVFYLLSLAMLVHMIHVAARMAEARAGPSRWGPFATWTAVLVLTGWPWMSGLTRGQASVMLSWLTIVGIDWLMRERPDRLALRWGGAFALALAAAIRIFPVLLGLWLILRRKWEAALACIVAGVALTVVFPAAVFGPMGNMQLLVEWVTTIALPTGDAAAESNARYTQMMDPRIDKNQSVQAVLVRWMAPTEESGADARERLARQIGLAVKIGLVGITLVASFVAGRRRRDDGGPIPMLQASAFVFLLLAVPPVSWTHNYSLMALPLAVLWVLASGPARSLPARIGLVVWLIGGLAAFIPDGGTDGQSGGELAGSFLLGGLAVWVATIIELLRVGGADEG